MTTIDLRSDTVTHPTPAMREAMYRAEVGDDVYGEDPTANKLEEMAAAKSGKEAALFVCSGTMGNLLALLAHCGRGDEVILGSESHIVVHEQGGIAALGSIHPRMVPMNEDGTMNLEEIENSVNPDDIHCARTKLICLENTWHGIPLSLGYMSSVAKIARDNKLLLHLDGARVFNAALALGVSAAEVAAEFDTVQFCFSKGLAAPMGSVLCGPKPFVEYARRLRKMLGGGMRQIGIVAAAAIVALESMVERLAEDHANARLLAEGLCSIDGLKVHRNSVHTNMVFCDVDLNGARNKDLVDKMLSRGVIAGEEGRHGIRFVTHYGITENDIKAALHGIELAVKDLAKQPAGVK